MLRVNHSETDTWVNWPSGKSKVAWQLWDWVFFKSFSIFKFSVKQNGVALALHRQAVSDNSSDSRLQIELFYVTPEENLISWHLDKEKYSDLAFMDGFDKKYFLRIFNVVWAVLGTLCWLIHSVINLKKLRIISDCS